MKSRIATMFTMVLLVAGTGGALAIGESGSSGGPLGGAASAQYCKHKTKNGKCVPPKPKHNCGKHHNQTCPNHKNKDSKHGTSVHKSTNTHKSTKKSTSKSKGMKGGTPISKCTLRKQQGLTILYCP